MKTGDILVTKRGVPGRFKKVVPGALFKVLGVRNFDGSKITVGDKYNPEGINTRSNFFEVVPANVAQAIAGQKGTHLGGRMKAILAFKPNLKTLPNPGEVAISNNDATIHMSRGVADALAACKPAKQIQRKLAAAVGRF